MSLARNNYLSCSREMNMNIRNNLTVVQLYIYLTYSILLSSFMHHLITYSTRLRNGIQTEWHFSGLIHKFQLRWVQLILDHGQSRMANESKMKFWAYVISSGICHLVSCVSSSLLSSTTTFLYSNLPFK
jgi:ABC-type glycerol-3-phosphate transport system permease component